MAVSPAHLVAVRRTVNDLARSVAFYAQGLGFELESQHAAEAVLRLGDQRLELVAADAALRGFEAVAEGSDTRFQHFAVVVSGMDALHARVTAAGARAITRGGPQRLPESSGGVTAFKCRDPDGHPLELIAFPPGAGDARWQTSGAPRALGIDHAALSAADAARSIAFYAEVLGLQVAARQTNRGPEQARLDGLDAPVVDVIALEAPGRPTPHLELLVYASPTVRVEPPAPWADRLVFACAVRESGEGRGTDPDGHPYLLRQV